MLCKREASVDCVFAAGSDGSFYQVKASSMSLMELVYDALLYPRETK